MSRPKGSKNKSKEEIIPEVTESTPGNDVKEDEATKITAKPAHLSKSAAINEIAEMNKELQAQEEKPLEEPIPEIAEPEAEEKSDVEEQEKEIPIIVKHKFIIDGEEIELTEDQIRERIQKNESADKRLAEATRLLEDARKATLAKEPPQPPAKTSSEADVDKEFIQSAAKALLYGDEEQVTKAVAEILGKRREDTTKPSMTREEIRRDTLEAIDYRDGLKLLETPSDQGGYADVYSDPVLKLRFHQLEAEYRDIKKDGRPYTELYKVIGNEIRQWRDDLIKQHVQPTGLEDRDKLKAATGVIRGAGGKLPAAPMKTPKSAREAHEETVENARRSRGLN